MLFFKIKNNDFMIFDSGSTKNVKALVPLCDEGYF